MTESTSAGDPLLAIILQLEVAACSAADLQKAIAAATAGVGALTRSGMTKMADRREHLEQTYDAFRRVAEVLPAAETQLSALQHSLRSLVNMVYMPPRPIALG